MNRLLTLATLLFLLSPVVAQDIGSGVQAAREEEQRQRMRGRSVVVEDVDSAKISPRTVNLSDIQSKTKELSGLVQSLNGDMKTLQKGMLPADMTQRLKRIEKLAKDLRHTLQ